MAVCDLDPGIQTASTFQLTLVGDAPDPLPEPDVPALRFDRRRFGRNVASVTGAASFHARGAGARLAQAKIVDAGSGGLGMLSPVPASVGSTCTFYAASERNRVPFPPVRGTVVRCVMTPDGYRVGIRCDQSRAAA